MAFPISQQKARGYGPAFSTMIGINFVDLMRRSFATGIQAATSEVETNARAFYNALNEYKSGKGGSRSLASANRRIADSMQEAVLESYDERVTNAPGRLPSYRIGENRYSGGALRRALAHPEMFSASYQGITFMNKAILDKEAAHWARLNWGAGSRASEGFSSHPVRLQVFGQTLGVLSPPNHPQPGFAIPRGVWVGGERKWGNRPRGFYPTSKTEFFPTRGIAARRFFDAAYDALALNMPTEYENLLHEWVDQASRTFKGVGARAIVRGLPIGSFVGGGGLASTYSAKSA